MKTIKFKWLSLLALWAVSTTFYSCNQDDDRAPDSISVNDFVWKGLNLWYYWQQEVPDLADDRFGGQQAYLDYINSKQTDDLFFGLLHQYGTTDRFSWIVPDYHTLDNQFAGINQSFGMKYGLVYKSQDSNELFGYVQYVLPNSPASAAGLKRGDLFTKINGTQLTDSNYTSLLANQTVNLGMAFIQNGEIFDLNETISVFKTELHENPVFLSKIITQNGHKIGYLLYNNFRANFNQELNQAIGELEAEGITELVLDLRYNGGGSVQTAAYLGSMITGQFDGQDFTKLNFNHKASNNNQTYLFENEGKLFNNQLQNIGQFSLNHLNLNRLYVLTSGSTASASEMIINCLNPYIEVVVIGRKTFGKTVGSITLYDSPSTQFTQKSHLNPAHTWAMQPIVFDSKNAQDQSSPINGIPVDYEINEIHYLGNLKDLGDENEALLALAIQLISGNSSKVKPTSTTVVAFKNSHELERFGTEMYLDKGFEIK